MNFKSVFSETKTLSPFGGGSTLGVLRKGEFMKRILLAFISAIALFGCTDANIASVSAIGRPAHIKCYSGNIVIFEGDSTGRISTVQNSDGWEFMDAKTNKFVRVSGPCVIMN